MYDLLHLYNIPYWEREPVVCIDEKSKQLLKDTRRPLPAKPGAPAKQDYEYQRAGTCNLLVAVEPKGRRRVVAVTERRAKPDFVGFVKMLLEQVYVSARKVHLVLDNLNTHFRSCFDEVLGRKAAARLLRRVEFHYTPKHASWLNITEIEIGSLTANVSIAAWRIEPPGSRRSPRGNTAATRSAGASSGPSLAKTRTENWPGIMFRN